MFRHFLVVQAGGGLMGLAAGSRASLLRARICVCFLCRLCIGAGDSASGEAAQEMEAMDGGTSMASAQLYGLQDVSFRWYI